MPTAACENSPATTDVAFPTHRTSLRPWRSALPHQGNRRPPGAMTQTPPPAAGTIETLPMFGTKNMSTSDRRRALLAQLHRMLEEETDPDTRGALQGPEQLPVASRSNPPKLGRITKMRLEHERAATARLAALEETDDNEELAALDGKYTGAARVSERGRGGGGAAAEMRIGGAGREDRRGSEESQKEGAGRGQTGATMQYSAGSVSTTLNSTARMPPRTRNMSFLRTGR